MYKLTVNGNSYTIPKQNLRFLAIMKAKDLNKNVKLDTVENAIEFFNSIGVEVEEM